MMRHFSIQTLLSNESPLQMFSNNPLFRYIPQSVRIQWWIARLSLLLNFPSPARLFPSRIRVVAKVITCGHFVFFLFLEVKCSNSDLWHQVSILHFCMHNLRHIKIHQPIQIVRSQSSCAKAWQSFFYWNWYYIFTPVYEYLFLTKHSLTPQRQVKNMFFGFLKPQKTWISSFASLRKLVWPFCLFFCFSR